MHAFNGADEESLRLLNGMIPDLATDFTAHIDNNEVSTVFDSTRTLCDTKTLACGDVYKSFEATDHTNRATYPVEVRAKNVNKEYFTTARALDRKIHNTTEGSIGPIEARLLEFGNCDDHAVIGLVMGAFGELSSSCYALATAIARVHAARLTSYYHMDHAKALSLAKQKIIRFWGLTAHRGWARLILNRRLGLVVSPSDLPNTAPRDPDQDALDLFTFFNPTTAGHGASFAAGFGPRDRDTGA
jgi:hypothetical protein